MALSSTKVELSAPTMWQRFTAQARSVDLRFSHRADEQAFVDHLQAQLVQQVVLPSPFHNLHRALEAEDGVISLDVARH